MGWGQCKHDDDIKRLHAQGMTCPQIAREVGMTRDGVRFACARLGLPINRGDGLPANRFDAQIAEMRADGIGSRGIAERLGVTRDFVLDRFHALGGIRNRKRPTLDDDTVMLKPFEELSIYHQRTLRRLLPAWFGEEMR